MYIKGIDIWEKGYRIAIYQYTSKPIGNIEHKAGERKWIN